MLDRIANSSTTGCNLETFAPENRNLTFAGASSRVSQAIRLYYRGRRRASRPDLPSVYRPRWSSMLVCVSCQPIYLSTRSGSTMYSSLFSGSRHLPFCSVVHRRYSFFLSLFLVLGSAFYPKGKGRDASSWSVTALR